MATTWMHALATVARSMRGTCARARPPGFTLKKRFMQRVNESESVRRSLLKVHDDVVDVAIPFSFSFSVVWVGSLCYVSRRVRCCLLSVLTLVSWF